MSIKRSHEVINLCDQAIEVEPARPRRFSIKPRHVHISDITTSDSSDEFRDWTMPSYTKALVVAEIVAASVLFSLQVCVLLERKSSGEVSASEYMTGIYLVAILVIIYAAGVITWMVVREPSGCRVGFAFGLQTITIIPAFIVLVQSITSLQQLFEDHDDAMHEDTNYFHQEETSTRVIHVVIIPFATIIVSAAILIIVLLARATKFCSSIWENKNKKAAAFEFESVSHSQSQHF